MKRNDFLEIKNLTVDNLLAKVKKTKEDLAGLLIDKNMKKLADLKSIYKKRKEIAQILTVISQKRLLDQLEIKEGVEEKNR